MKLTIEDGRDSFYTFDTNRILLLTATDDEILDSKRKLNVFAEKATGFDAKARMKRAQKKAKEGKL